MIVTDSRKPSLLLLISRFKKQNSSAVCTYTIITRAHIRSIRTCLTAAFLFHLSFTESTRQRAYSLVAQAYTSITAEDFAAFVGYSVDEAVKGAVE